MSLSGEEKGSELSVEISEELSLRHTMSQLFVEQRSKSLIFYDNYNQNILVEEFLGGSMPSGSPNHFVRVEATSRTIVGGSEDFTLTVDSEQYLFGVHSICRADSQNDWVDRKTILWLRSILGPGMILWSKSLSRKLGNSVLDFYGMVDR
jgi:hypothetical protein